MKVIFIFLALKKISTLILCWMNINYYFFCWMNILFLGLVKLFNKDLSTLVAAYERLRQMEDHEFFVCV